MFMEKVNNTNEIDGHDIFILDSIFINLDVEGTLDDLANNNDGECETIDLNNDFPNMISK